ncbi:MAG TPA: amino acid adenylation domain-containing protein [Candidatus Angelobacter sp.]
MSDSSAAITEVRSSDIAIIAMNCRVPGARNINQFWENLKNGVESIVSFTDEELRAAGVPDATFNDPHYVRSAATLEGIELFDPAFFGFTPREAQSLDPQHRLFLESAWELLESAGYDVQSYTGSVGVYAGIATNNYVSAVLSHDGLVDSLGRFAIRLSNDKDFLATNISYRLNLRGPSVTVQTTCSTSLVAVHLACQSLFAGECDVAVAGGVSIDVPQGKGYLYSEGTILSPDGHCRAFDARAQGTISGSGVGTVLLKRLEDALADRDQIYTVIRGTAINNDGSSKVGFTAPSVEGQARVIRAAQALAEVPAETISYIEAHGTGTSLGDPIEMAGLTEAFRASTSKKGFCAIGSVKTNIGHLNTAAGVAGLIKTALALQHKQIPASLNFETPNPAIDFENSPVYVNTKLRPWSGPGPLRAGVSSFGMGGTNAHAILQEAPEQQPSGKSRPWQLLVLSARTETALAQASKNLAHHLKEHESASLADVAYTLQIGRKKFAHRQMFVCAGRNEAIEALEGLHADRVRQAVAPEAVRGVVFLFPGQGAQYVNMARQLYESEISFRRVVDECCERLKPILRLDLREIFFADPNDVDLSRERLTQTAMTQPALFVIEYALARLWMSWGVRPQAMIGHSIGEYVAACIAGTMSEEDALTLVCVRGQLMQEMDSGSMLAVQMSEEAAQRLLTPDVCIAAINSPQQCVLSGSSTAIDLLQPRLEEKGVHCRQLQTSHAFHSQMMDPMLERFERLVQEVKLRAPRIPWVSNRTGKPVTPDQATDHRYWVRHLREPVRFAAGIREILRAPGERIFLEVGPGQTLSALVRQNLSSPAGAIVVSSLPGANKQLQELPFLLDALGKLWLAGAEVNWQQFNAGEERHRVPLPTYPFERQSYLVAAASGEAARAQDSLSKRQNIAEWLYVPYWKPSVLSPHYVEQQEEVNWLFFLDEEGLGVELARELASAGQRVITVQSGNNFQELEKTSYVIRSQRLEDYETLLTAVHPQSKSPLRVVHLATLSKDTGPQAAPESSEALQFSSFYSLLFLTKVLGRHCSAGPVQVIVVSNHTCSVTGNDQICPENATVQGLCRVIPQEYPNLSCRSVDVELPPQESKQRRRLLAQLKAELLAEVKDSPTAYRGRNRWVQSFECVPLENHAKQPSRLRDRGAYLITGGLGKIGMKLAEYLAIHAKARLVLLGRSAFPAQEQWQSWLDCHDDHDPISIKIRTFRQLQEMGAEVLALQADVSNLQQLREIIKLTHNRFGPIHGVIHAAAHFGEGALKTIEDLDIADCEAHFQSKARSLLVLEEALRDEPLDFCLLFSSISTVLGGLTYSPYAAANHFLDAFAESRQRGDLRAWNSVNWDGWDFRKNQGTASPSTHGALQFSMTPEEGIEAFHRLLHMDSPARVVISTGNLDARLRRWAQPRSSDGPKSALPEIDYSRPVLGTPYVPPGNEVEAQICSLWQELLGIAQIGIHDSFFEIGGNSLMATQLLSRLRKTFKTEIRLTAIFENSTIAQLAKLLGMPVIEANVQPALRRRDPKSAMQVSAAAAPAPAADKTELSPYSVHAVDVPIHPQVERQRTVAPNLEATPQFGEEAVDTQTGRTVWWNAHGWSYSRPENPEIQTLPLLTPQPRPPQLPLSYAQQRLWFINKLQGATPEYNMTEALHLRGELNCDALERAINAIVARHEVLRTRFVEIDGEPAQIIDPELRIDIPLMDLSALPEARRQEWKAAFRREREDVFDLTRGPLLRMKLLKLAEHDHVLLRSFHHIISDGWSRGIFNRELMVLYEAFLEGQENPLPALAVQYADYTLWQRTWLDEGALGRELEYWKQKLSGAPEYLDLPLDRPRQSSPTFDADVCQLTLSAETVAAVKKYGHANQTTLYMTLLSVFAVLLQRYSGQNDIVVGSPIANRQDAHQEQLIGLFVNSLVMRVQVKPLETFRKLLATVRQTALEAYLHQDIPFEQLVEELSPQRSLSITPIFQVLFALQNAPMGSQHLTKLTIEPLAGDTHTVRVDLEVHAFERERQIALHWLYKRELFDRWRMEQMARHYVRLLEAVLADPDQPVNQFDLLSDGEKHQVLFEWNSAEAVPERQQTIAELFEAQAKRTPAAVAVSFHGLELTYAELGSRTNQLGHYLRKMGAGPEVRVGTCLERGPEMIVALLGIFKSGATYVPLDPVFPVERLAYMIQDTATRAVLTQAKFRSLLPTEIQFLDIEAGIDSIAAGTPETPLPSIDAQNAAYIIYTSGSTGRPKGVVIEHRNVHNMVLAQHAAFAPQESDRVLQFFSFSFDVSIFATLMALCSGARLVLGTSDELLPGPGLLSLLQTEAVTIGVLPPTVLDHLPPASLPELRKIIVGGEPWSEELLKTWGDGRQFFNSYGPTETTVQAAVGECKVGEGKPSIGRPIVNARIYLVDEQLRLVPAGVAGELYIAGEGLGRGYLDNALTAEKYLPDPFSGKPGSRMYRTGDWARWLPDGRIDLLGRKDEQVKIRGYRVELGEIESVLGQHPSVLQCAVMARQTEHRERRLVAYVVPSQPSARAGELRAYLKNKLPEYMVPAQFMMMEQLVLNSSGKVDRNALPEVEFGNSDIGRAPRVPGEEIMCQIFAEVLGLPRVSIDDNFFDLGGHSLMATRLVSRVRSVLAAELPLRAVFESPTVAELAPHLRQGGTWTHLVAQVRPESLPMSYAQQRLWFLDQLEGKSTEYHIPEALHLRGALDYEALAGAIDAIVERHEGLRTCFSQAADGEPVQIVTPRAEIELPLEDLTELSQDLQRQSIAAAMRYEREQPFDLARGPLLRLKLLKLGEREHILLRTFHHIITDGWSQGIFNRELAALYQAFHEDQPNPLEPLSIQYADFALWQRQWLDEELKDQLSYWKDKLSGIPEELALPKDHQRPPRQTFAGGACHVSLTSGQVAALKRLCQSNQATLYMMLLSVFAVLLQRYSGQDDIVLGSPIANRQDEKLENLIGFFVNSLVLRVQVTPEQSFHELLAQVRATALEAYRHQDLPFERLVEELSPQRSLNRTPIYQVLFLWQNAPMESPRFVDLEVAYLPGQELQTQFDLELQAMEKDGAIQLYWLYNRDLFDAWRIQQMASHFLRLVDAAINAPADPVFSLPMLEKAEEQKLLVDWNSTERLHAAEEFVHTLFEQQAERTPSAVAVVCESEQITYGELNERSNQLAHYLRELGVRPDMRVGICLERGLQVFVGLLGILKAGAAYVPLDPKHPAERLRYILEDSRVAVALTEQATVAALPVFAGTVICLDEHWSEIAARSSNNPATGTAPENLAYVIYTSGSTGTPKGVAVEHRQLSNQLLWAGETLELTSADRVLQKASCSFDVSILETLLPLTRGTRVISAKPEGGQDLDYLVRLGIHGAVTYVDLVPSLLEGLLIHPLISRWTSLRVVSCGGEALQPQLVSAFYQALPTALLWNAYGPTETTVQSTYAVCAQGDSSVAIGKPIANTHVYVLDRWLSPLPVGVAGELFIAGAGVARGYLNRSDLTAACYLPDPFSVRPGSRMYRTGDRVRRRVDGDLEFLGRDDDQVKIRGFRIELGEIESALCQCPDVRQAVVLAREQDSGNKQLVAYVATREPQSLNANHLRDYLKNRLPEYMTPYHFVFLERLPLTPGGKVNRGALPKLQQPAPDMHVAPRTALEQLLAKAWQQALSLDRVSLDDNFFDLGAHSLLVARVRFVLGEQLKRDISLMDFFTYPTIRSLARGLEQTEEKPISISDSQERAARQKANLRMRRLRALEREQQQEAVND